MIKNIIRKWLGIEENENRIDQLDELYKDLVGLGIDISPTHKHPHMIFIFSSLKGGQIREFPANFNNLRELEDFCKYLKNKFRTDNIIIDKPYEIPKTYFRF